MSLLDRFRSPKGEGEQGGRPQPTPAAAGQVGSPTTWPKPTPGGTVLRSGAPKQASLPAPGKCLSLPTFAVGDRIADTYVVRKVIQSGGMGDIYVAYHERWNLDLVLKAPKPELLADPDALQRLVREAEAWTALGLHPHIAYCYYVHPLDGVPLLVIEYLDGGNLRDWIADGRCADLKVGLDLAIQACHALEHAHSRGMVHRDIKPANILMASDGTLKVTDFGLVRVGTPAPPPSDGPGPIELAGGTTQPGVGTWDYMPPEQFIDTHTVDARADLFALGVCLYEMFCGRRPYTRAVGPRQEPPDPRQLRGGDTLPARLCTLLLSCVDWDPTRRPESAQALRQELCGVYQEVFVHPSPWADLPEVSLEADGWNNRGVSYWELKRDDRTFECFAEALKANPHHLEATFNQAVLQWRRADIDDLEVLRRVERLASAPGIDPKEWALAKAEVHQERFSESEAREALAPYHKESEEHLMGREASKIELVRTIVGHCSVVTSLALTPDGRKAVSGSLDETLMLWDLDRRDCLWNIKAHNGCIHAVAMTSDSRRILSSAGDGTLRLWDLDSGECRKVFDVPSIASIVTMPDSRFVLLGQGDGTLILLDLNSGERQQTFKGHRKRVTSIVVASNGYRAISSSEDTTLRFWDLQTGQCLETIEAHAEPVTCVALTLDGRHAISGSADHTLRLWDLQRGQCLQTMGGHAGPVRCVALTPDGRLAISGSDDGTLKLWELQTTQCIRTLEGHRGSVTCVKIASHGRRVLSGSQDRTLKLWDPGDSACLWTFAGPPDRVCAVAISSDCQRALSGETDKTLKLWHLGTGQCLRTFGPHLEKVSFAAFAADERLAVSGSWFKAMKLWDLETGECLQVLDLFSKGVAEAARTPDGRWTLTSTGALSLRLWNLETGQCVQTFEGSAKLAALPPDGRHALRDYPDRTLKLCDVTTGRCVRTFKGHTGDVTAVALTPDGRHLLSGSDDRSLKLWEIDVSSVVVSNLKLCRPLQLGEVRAHQSALRGVLKTIESLIAAGSQEEACQTLLSAWGPIGFRMEPEIDRLYGALYAKGNIRDLATIVEVSQRGHRELVSSVALTPDGRHGLSGSADRRLRLWDLQTGQCVRTIEGHSEPVTCVALTPDGRHGLSGSADRTLRLWDLQTGQCVRTIEVQLNRGSTVALASDGRYCVCSSGRNLKVWNMCEGSCIRTISSLFTILGPSALTHEGRHVVLAGPGLYLLDMCTGQVLKRLMREDRSSSSFHVVVAGALSGDGRLALSQTADETFDLWNVTSGKHLRTLGGLSGHYAGCLAVSGMLALTHDGRIALSSDLDGPAVVWDVNNDQKLAIMTVKSEIQSIAINSNAYCVLCGHKDGTMTYWRLIWNLRFAPRLLPHG